MSATFEEEHYYRRENEKPGTGQDSETEGELGEKITHIAAELARLQIEHYRDTKEMISRVRKSKTSSSTTGERTNQLGVRELDQLKEDYHNKARDYLVEEYNSLVLSDYDLLASERVIWLTFTISILLLATAAVAFTFLYMPQSSADITGLARDLSIVGATFAGTSGVYGLLNAGSGMTKRNAFFNTLSKKVFSDEDRDLHQELQQTMHPQ